MKGIYKLLLLFLAFAILTLPACGNEWLIREYCSRVVPCAPEMYLDENDCFNRVKAEADAYPRCETQLEDYYECVMDVQCKGYHGAETECDSAWLDTCEAQYGGGY